MSRHWPLGKSSPYKHSYPYKTGVNTKWVWDNESFPHLCFHAEPNLATAHDAGTKVDMRLQLWALRDVGAPVLQHRNRSDRLCVTDTDLEGSLPVSLCVQVWWICWQVALYSPDLNELNVSTTRPILHLSPPPFSRDLPWPQRPHNEELTRWLFLHLPSWCSQMEPKYFPLTTTRSLESSWESWVIHSQPDTIEYIEQTSEQDTRSNANLWENCSKDSELPTELVF